MVEPDLFVIELEDPDAGLHAQKLVELVGEVLPHIAEAAAGEVFLGGLGHGLGYASPEGAGAGNRQEEARQGQGQPRKAHGWKGKSAHLVFSPSLERLHVDI